MVVNNRLRWWEPLLAFVVGAFAVLSTAALLAGCWVGGASCSRARRLPVSRDLALFVAGRCLLIAVMWHVSSWLFGPGGAC